MSESKTFPIFSMLNDFESKSFHMPEIKAQHRSLYYFLVSVLMHRRGSKRFEMAYDYGMMGSKIGNHTTYTNTLSDLEKFGFIKYTPGKNRFVTPVIDMQFCKPTANLLKTYCESIGVSTVNNIKAIDTEDTIETKEIYSFESFWNAYAKKSGKVKSKAEWDKLKPDERNAAYEYIPKYHKKTPDVTFRKDPERYLKYKLWQDEAPVSDNRKIIGYVPTFCQDAYHKGQLLILSKRPIYEGDALPVTFHSLEQIAQIEKDQQGYDNTATN